MSLPARGVWVEIQDIGNKAVQEASLPARGVWVEIASTAEPPGRPGSLPARGVWVEIYLKRGPGLFIHRHSPRGECGLKFVIQSPQAHHITVTPREGSVG